MSFQTKDMDHFKGQVKPHYAIKPKLLLQCHKNDFLWAKEMTTTKQSKDSCDRTLLFM